jgi:hypothetical protein
MVSSRPESWLWNWWKPFQVTTLMEGTKSPFIGPERYWIYEAWLMDDDGRIVEHWKA